MVSYLSRLEHNKGFVGLSELTIVVRKIRLSASVSNSYVPRVKQRTSGSWPSSTSSPLVSITLYVGICLSSSMTELKKCNLGVMAECDVPGRRPWWPEGLSGAEVASLRRVLVIAAFQGKAIRRMEANMASTTRMQEPARLVTHSASSLSRGRIYVTGSMNKTRAPS